MIDYIKLLLDIYEVENGVEVLYAVLFGSREFGHDRPNSDYDVALVYKGERLASGGGFIDTESGSYISFNGAQVDDFYDLLRDSSQYQWNFINGKEVLRNVDNFKERTLATYRYERSELVKSMYYFVLTIFGSRIIEKGSEPVVSGYLKCISAIMRIKWLEENDNINFPQLKETFMYLNEEIIADVKVLLNTSTRCTIRYNALDRYIIDELERIKGEYQIA